MAPTARMRGGANGVDNGDAVAGGKLRDAEEKLVSIGVVLRGEEGVEVSDGWRGSVGPDGVDDGLAKGLVLPREGELEGGYG